MLPSWEERRHWTDAQHSPTEQTAGSRLSSTFFSSQTLILFNIMIPNNNFFNILNSNIDILNSLMPDTDCFQDCDPKYCYLLTFWCLTIIMFKFVISNIDFFDTMMPKWVFQSSASRSLPDNAKMWLCNNCTRGYIKMVFSNGISRDLAGQREADAMDCKRKQHRTFS